MAPAAIRQLLKSPISKLKHNIHSISCHTTRVTFSQTGTYSAQTTMEAIGNELTSFPFTRNFSLTFTTFKDRLCTQKKDFHLSFHYAQVGMVPISSLNTEDLLGSRHCSRCSLQSSKEYPAHSPSKMLPLRCFKFSF